MAAKGYFVDTWAWLVLADDSHAAFGSLTRLRAVSIGDGSPWVTTDYVLDETMTRLFAATPFTKARQFMEGIFQASHQGLLDIEHVTPERFRNAWRLRLRYRDKPRISFTDLTSFVVMRELGLHEVLTGDSHFEQVGLGFLKLP